MKILSRHHKHILLLIVLLLGTSCKKEQPPLVSKIEVNTIRGAINMTSVVCGGEITSNNVEEIIERGVSWDTLSNPELSDNKIESGKGSGIFSIEITGLTPGRDYYIRAYAKTAIGVVYGNEISFTTLGGSVPTVITTPVTNITQTSAQGGGNIISDGGSPVLQRGVSYNYSGGPYWVTIDGNGPGIYISQMNNLYPFTWYSVRAYATNAVGTGYGVALSFNTLQPTISAPILKTPMDNANVGCCSVNFEWQPNVYAEFYYFQISRSADFSEAIYSANIACAGSEIPRTTGVFNVGTGATSYCIRMDNASLNGIWYWRVQILGSGILSPWSVVRSFNFTN